MTTHNFIFSDQRKHRLARHITFWLIWCLAFNLLFHFPIHVFKGWDVSGPGTKNFQELGPVVFFIKALIVNSFLGVIVPQIALYYFLTNWLLPHYYFKRKNRLVALTITVAALLIFYYVAIVFKFSPEVYNKIVGNANSLRPFPAIDQVVIIDQLNSLPIVLGFALIIKFVKRSWQKRQQTELLAKEKTKAELQLLKAQVHPHFLFNTLNNIYFFTLTNSAQAPQMIQKLSGMLHYILNECNLPLVPLEKEIKMIRNYMALEKIRYGEQMQMTIDIKDSQEGNMIAPLLLIPFVENSFKHGASKMITHPWVKLNIYIEKNRFHFMITNSKPLTNESSIVKGNIGLKNVTKRLELLYPATHELKIVSDSDSYSVSLILQLYEIKDYTIIKDEVKPLNEYAMG